MQSLQIQDAFEPYYVDQPVADDKSRTAAEKRPAGLKRDDMRARLTEYRDRLAKKIGEHN